MDRKIEKIGLIPVITITNPEKDAEQIANILIDCNIPIAEVTYRTDRASDSIKIMKRFKKDIIVGGGTVLNIEQLDEVVNAGADFIVSPGMDEKLVEYAINNNIKIYPDCCTPSDIQKAVNLGIERIKFFPATQLSFFARMGNKYFLQLIIQHELGNKFLKNFGIWELIVRWRRFYVLVILHHNT